MRQDHTFAIVIDLNDLLQALAAVPDESSDFLDKPSNIAINA